MGIKLFIFLAGLLALALTACTSGQSEIGAPADQLGMLSGSVTIGPLCPVEPCNSEIGDTYSSRQILLQGVDSGNIFVSLDPDGNFWEEVPAGIYQVTLDPCEHLGCSGTLPVQIEIIPGETYTLNINIDTGIRSPVRPS